MSKYKTIGIIGGQGPTSTVDIYMRIIKYFRTNFHAKYVGDYPPMIIYSVPTPDLVESIENEEVTYMKIQEALKKLEEGGVDFIIIACNSLQYMLDRFQKTITTPIIGMAPIVAKHLKDKNYKTIGILATDTTIKKKVYDFSLKANEIKLVIPNEGDQNIVADVILKEIGGKTSTEDAEKLKQVILNLEKDGAEAVILACTELPLILKQKDVLIPLIDCNELYAYEAGRLSSNI